MEPELVIQSFAESRRHAKDRAFAELYTKYSTRCVLTAYIVLLTSLSLQIRKAIVVFKYYIIVPSVFAAILSLVIAL